MRKEEDFIKLKELAKPEKEWLNYIIQNDSVITDLFVSQILVVYDCGSCRSKEENYKMESMLILNSTRNVHTNLRECFDLYEFET